ncbi:amidohydrolase family protein [Cyanobium sp. FGCU-6]|nr:amidohydrolase family protein [Cyanobium sp. FGCU6]
MSHALPPLRIPRVLLDPADPRLRSDADGLVRVRLEVEAGRVTAIRPLATGAGSQGAPDAPLALTPLVEAHAHLDKAYTREAFPNRRGTIAGALEANLREIAQRRPEQVEARAEVALERAWRNGLRAIRTHVDTLGPCGPGSWEVLEQLANRWADRLELQRVALVPLGHWLTGEGQELARRVAASGGVLGGVLGLPGRRQADDADALRALLALAGRFACPVDLHIDEADGAPAYGLKLLSRELRQRRAAVPIVCSHASSMGLLAAGACRRLAEALAPQLAGVVALPSTNLWLLSRHPGRTPGRRPLAPIRQLQEAGIAVAVGGDNVQDPWYPGGDFDPIDLLRFALPAAQLEPWRRNGLAPFTTAAARVLGLSWDGVLRPGAPADLVVLGATGWSDLLGRTPQRRVLRSGRWLPPPPQQEPSALLASLSL